MCTRSLALKSPIAIDLIMLRSGCRAFPAPPPIGKNAYSAIRGSQKVFNSGQPAPVGNPQIEERIYLQAALQHLCVLKVPSLLSARQTFRC